MLTRSHARTHVQVSNFAFQDPVVEYIAPNYDMTLVLISHIYTTKILLDCQAVGVVPLPTMQECSASANGTLSAAPLPSVCGCPPRMWVPCLCEAMGAVQCS